MTLEWKQPRPWFVESMCGRYKVAKYWAHGTTRFEAWHLTTQYGWVRLGDERKADEAKALAQRHAEQKA